MTLDELYPYWDETHQDLIDLVGILTDEQIEYRPNTNARDIRRAVLQFVNDERFWIGNLVGRLPMERATVNDFPTAAHLVDALTATREVTKLVLGRMSRENLRDVRAVPEDQAANIPETNMPVSWLIWHIVENEIICLGQVKQRVEDQ